MAEYGYTTLEPATRLLKDTLILDAVAQLVQARREAGRTQLYLPILYPSGAHVGVTVYEDGERFYVTDDGSAADECDMAGVSSQAFSRTARSHAKEAGAGFDGRGVFYLRVESDRLPAAITILGNLCAEVASTAVRHHAAAVRNPVLETLYAHLERAFPPQAIQQRAVIPGRSISEHDVAAKVTLEGRTIVFDTFTAHPQSVNSIVAKFLDIQMADDAPVRVGVTARKEKLGDRLMLVRTVGRVIEASAPEEVYKSAAAA